MAFVAPALVLSLVALRYVRAASGCSEVDMHILIKLLVQALEVLFAIGVVGSALVILLSTVEDAKTLRNKD